MVLTSPISSDKQPAMSFQDWIAFKRHVKNVEMQQLLKAKRAQGHARFRRRNEGCPLWVKSNHPSALLPKADFVHAAGLTVPTL
jgi:hypothetical protein